MPWATAFTARYPMRALERSSGRFGNGSSIAKNMEAIAKAIALFPTNQ